MDTPNNQPEANSGQNPVNPSVDAPQSDYLKDSPTSIPGAEIVSQTPNEANLGHSVADQTQALAQQGSASLGNQPSDSQQVNMDFDNYTSNAPGTDEPGLTASANSYSQEPEAKGSRLGLVITIILVIIIVVGIWRSNEGNNGNLGQNNEETGSVKVDDTKETGNVTIINGDQADKKAEISGETIKIVAYYNKLGLAECENVVPLERQAEKRYDSEVINTVRGLLTPLSQAETAQGFITSLPVGTYLKNVSIKDGVAKVVLSSSLNNVAGSCRVLAIRSQVEKTLLQFPYVKSVLICVDDNCRQDEILQP